VSCSNDAICAGDVILDFGRDEVTVGAKSGALYYTETTGLYTWCCPACGYEDSYWPYMEEE
jgi:hypothetical protein